MATGRPTARWSLNADGSFTYTPNANFNGTDSFTYTVTDGTADSNVATVTITVDPVNDAPVATDDALHDRRGHAAAVAATCVRPTTPTWTARTLTASVTHGAANGTFALNADGSFTYTPDANFNGTDSFTYTVTDGQRRHRRRRR